MREHHGLHGVLPVTDMSEHFRDVCMTYHGLYYDTLPSFAFAMYLTFPLMLCSNYCVEIHLVYDKQCMKWFNKDQHEECQTCLFYCFSSKYYLNGWQSLKTRGWLHTYIYIYIHIYTYYPHKQTCVCMSTCMIACVGAHLYASKRMYMYINNIYIYMYTHAICIYLCCAV